MTARKKKLVAFSTCWGTRFGGINSFNFDLIRAFAGVAFDETEIICVVLSATAEDVEDAKSDQVSLIEIGIDSSARFSPDLEPVVWEALGRAGLSTFGDEVWLGHDRITGPIALAAAKKRGGRAAVIHHMSYVHYEAYAESSGVAKEKEIEQRQIFRAADIVFAVGPLLRDAAADLLDHDNVTMLIPGLPDIATRRQPRTFRAFLSDA